MPTAFGLPTVQRPMVCNVTRQGQDLAKSTTVLSCSDAHGLYRYSAGATLSLLDEEDEVALEEGALECWAMADCSLGRADVGISVG